MSWFRLCAAGAVAVAWSAPGTVQAQTVAEEALIGVWGSESVFGPRLRGELAARRDGEEWTIQLGALERRVPAIGDTVRAEFGATLGSLQLVESSGELRGFWIQPPGNMPAYATPVTLLPVASGAWRGMVHPIDERLSIFLGIRRAEDGLRARFHNPEFNWGRGAWFRPALRNDSLTLTDVRTDAVRFVLPWDAEQRRIGMDFGQPISLTMRADDAAPGFFARSPSAPLYRYRVPLPRSDGWPVAHARDAGMSESRLESMVRRISATDPHVEVDVPRIHSVVVARHGRLVLDEYFYGFAPDRPHDLRSASKTITSIMAGIAMQRGAPFDMSSPLYALLAEPTGGDPAKRRITVGHLLTHSAGWACDDNDPDSPGNEDRMQQQLEEPDWYRYALALPMSAEPGASYSYCSAGINLVGRVISRLTETSLVEFFDRHIARPLRIERYGVNLMPSGEAYAAGGMHMLPRDFLKLGQLFLDNGVWQGARLLSEEWVRESTAPRIRRSDGGSDGYGWHRHELLVGEERYQSYEASGNGGQFLIVVPELDLVVIITGGNYGQFPIWRTIRDEWVADYILAAVDDRD